jgi:hypothetical protein
MERGYHPFPIIPRIAAGRSAGSITSLAFGDRGTRGTLLVMLLLKNTRRNQLKNMTIPIG